MKYTASLTVAALLTATSVGATTPAFFNLEIIHNDVDGGNYGPFPSAITEVDAYDEVVIAAYALKSQIAADTDVGLPYTFNQECFTDTDLCKERFYGSDNPSDLSFENAYQGWRNDTADIEKGLLPPSSYFMSATSVSGGNIIGFGYDTDVKINDVVETETDLFTVGFGSAPYENGTRDFVRRGFVIDSSGNLTALTAPFDTYGGFTSAYSMRDVEYADGTMKTLIIGSASQSFPRDEDRYFRRCHQSNEDDNRYNLNELVNCPGFDTQAWAWEYDSLSSELSGTALATHWLDNNTTRRGSSTYSAAAFDINSQGVAVGVSSFEYRSNNEGARQRAIMMIPDEGGNYGEPTEINKVYTGIEDQEDSLYNTWAMSINEDNVVLGNREYAYVKGRNIPIEMFIYDHNTDEVTFPFLDKKVLSTKQRLDGESATKNGANSQGYDMNSDGWVVGKADAYNQTDPVYGGILRSQSAFLYDNTSQRSWFLDDLICEMDVDGTVLHPLIRLQSARAINDAGVILAEGYQYSSIENFKYKLDATPIIVTLTLTDLLNTDPDSSPNCWESEALIVVDEPYERNGGAAYWLLFLSIPLLLMRKLHK